VYQTTPWPAVAPNSASRINRQFRFVPRLSLSGCDDVFPASFSALYRGDSRSRSRMYSDIMTRMNESRKGMRQPQAANASLPSDRRVTSTTASEMNRPMVAVV
jgi:hypothetical protein